MWTPGPSSMGAPGAFHALVLHDLSRFELAIELLVPVLDLDKGTGRALQAARMLSEALNLSGCLADIIDATNACSPMPPRGRVCQPQARGRGGNAVFDGLFASCDELLVQLLVARAAIIFCD